MREVKVTSLEKLEATDGGVRILANSGDLALVFPHELWKDMLAGVSTSPEPATGELEELWSLRRHLEEHARQNSFATVLRDVPCGGEDSEWRFDLVLRPAAPFAVTTGYAFLPVVLPEHVASLGARLEEDGFVEQAYLVGAVADQRALAAGDEGSKALSIRGKMCSVSRFECEPELWQVLAERGWNNVETVAPGVGANHRKEG
jgi:hypothetical protein